MSDDSRSKEQIILSSLRRALGNILKDTAPSPGRPHPLKEGTIQEIRDLFGLIAAREAELADQAGITRNEKPYYADEPQNVSVVEFHGLDQSKKPHSH